MGKGSVRVQVLFECCTLCVKALLLRNLTSAVFATISSVTSFLTSSSFPSKIRELEMRVEPRPSSSFATEWRDQRKCCDRAGQIAQSSHQNFSSHHFRPQPDPQPSPARAQSRISGARHSSAKLRSFDIERSLVISSLAPIAARRFLAPSFLSCVLRPGFASLHAELTGRSTICYLIYCSVFPSPFDERDESQGVQCYLI